MGVREARPPSAALKGPGGPPERPPGRGADRLRSSLARIGVMSRSKRQPYFTDQQTNRTGRVRLAKRTASRAVRTANKKACGESEADNLVDGRSYRKASNSWDIRDWSFYSPDQKKAHRK